jgi:DNA-binding transcriptional MerR regulator
LILETDGLDQQVTTTEASTLFGVTAAAIRKWASLGKIDAVGIDRCGRKLYRLGDLALYEKRTRHAAGRDKHPIGL